MAGEFPTEFFVHLLTKTTEETPLRESLPQEGLRYSIL